MIDFNQTSQPRTPLSLPSDITPQGTELGHTTFSHLWETSSIEIVQHHHSSELNSNIECMGWLVSEEKSVRLSYQYQDLRNT